MKSPRTWQAFARSAALGTAHGVAVFVRDVGRGMLDISHNTFALCGLLVVIGAMLIGGRDDLRLGVETQALSWLQARQQARIEDRESAQHDEPAMPAEPEAVTRATAIDPRELDRQQVAVTEWLARRYRVAAEPVGRLVHEAWHLGKQAGLDPTLILAVMAIESSFNPFAQSPVGAQGLMQVMTKIHNDKYEPFGGTHAAFDPVTNLRVGVQVLKECIKRAGGLEAGLRYYVGAANLPDDGGYSGKVLAMQRFLREVVRGKSISPHVAMATAHDPAAPQAGGTTASATLLVPPLSSQAPTVRVATLD